MIRDFSIRIAEMSRRYRASSTLSEAFEEDDDVLDALREILPKKLGGIEPISVARPRLTSLEQQQQPDNGSVAAPENGFADNSISLRVRPAEDEEFLEVLNAINLYYY